MKPERIAIIPYQEHGEWTFALRDISGDGQLGKVLMKSSREWSEEKEAIDEAKELGARVFGVWGEVFSQNDQAQRLAANNQKV